MSSAFDIKYTYSEYQMKIDSVEEPYYSQQLSFILGHLVEGYRTAGFCSVCSHNTGNHLLQ